MQWFQSPRDEAADWPGDCEVLGQQFVSGPAKVGIRQGATDMSLFGALFSGVSGLAAQSQAMGIIADNITTVNTTAFNSPLTKSSLDEVGMV